MRRPDKFLTLGSNCPGVLTFSYKIDGESDFGQIFFDDFGVPLQNNFISKCENKLFLMKNTLVD